MEEKLGDSWRSYWRVPVVIRVFRREGSSSGFGSDPEVGP